MLLVRCHRTRHLTLHIIRAIDTYTYLDMTTSALFDYEIFYKQVLALKSTALHSVQGQKLYENYIALVLNASQTRTLRSEAAERICRPSAEKQTDDAAPVCPSKTRRGSPVRASHNIIVLSAELDAMCTPLGETAMPVIRDVCF